MTDGPNLFSRASDSPDLITNLPEGFRYRRELIDGDDEEFLLSHVRELPFRDFEFGRDRFVHSRQLACMLESRDERCERREGHSPT